MNKYSPTSRKRLNKCHILLQSIFESSLPEYDHSIITGHRNEKEQTKMFDTGRSQLEFPDSNHNKLPSLATDACPWPQKWEDWEDTPKERAQLYYFAGYIKGKAEPILKDSGYKLRWGGDWDGDLEFTDQTFDDLVHFEIVPE